MTERRSRPDVTLTLAWPMDRNPPYFHVAAMQRGADGAGVPTAISEAQRPPLTEPDPIRDHCLTPAERAKYIDGTLWGGGPSPL